MELGALGVDVSIGRPVEHRRGQNCHQGKRQTVNDAVQP